MATGLRKAMASRATIEQAKGALMLVYGLDAEAAFSLLSWQSQRSNIKLRDLAERLVAVVGGDAYASAAIRQRLDEIVYSLPAGPAAPLAPGQPEDDLLTVEQEIVDGAVVLHLRGEIDMATGPLLDEQLTRAVTVATPPAPLVVDLSKVQHLGSVGVALLTACHRRCHASGIPMRIVAGDGPIASILSMIPIGLDIYDEVAGALAPGSPAVQPAAPSRGSRVNIPSPDQPDPMDPDRRDLNLDVMHRNPPRLGKLASTLLDFARIEPGRMEASYEPADLAALTAGVAASFRAVIEKAGLSFDVDCPALGEPVHVDRDMWEKIVLNLLSNALKYTFEGFIRVSLRREPGDPGCAVLRVADSGTGIAEADLPQLFERFHRVYQARSRSQEGQWHRAGPGPRDDRPARRGYRRGQRGRPRHHVHGTAAPGQRAPARWRLAPADRPGPARQQRRSLRAGGIVLVTRGGDGLPPARTDPGAARPVTGDDLAAARLAAPGPPDGAPSGCWSPAVTQTCANISGGCSARLTSCTRSATARTRWPRPGPAPPDLASAT